MDIVQQCHSLRQWYQTTHFFKQTFTYVLNLFLNSLNDQKHNKKTKINTILAI